MHLVYIGVMCNLVVKQENKMSYCYSLVLSVYSLSHTDRRRIHLCYCT